MAKKPVSLDGLVNTAARTSSTGIPQRGAVPATQKKAHRRGGKRLTLALDGDAYRRLRLHAAKTDRTHQAILEEALSAYLDSMDA